MTSSAITDPAAAAPGVAVGRLVERGVLLRPLFRDPARALLFRALLFRNPPRPAPLRVLALFRDAFRALAFRALAFRDPLDLRDPLRALRFRAPLDFRDPPRRDASSASERSSFPLRVVVCSAGSVLATRR